MPYDRWRSSHDLQLRARLMRGEMTVAEKRLWQAIKNGQLLGAQFRRQYAIGPYIVDFYCAKAKLVIEVDGVEHLEHVEYDEYRTEWLTMRLKCSILRFSNHEVYSQLDSVLARIRWALQNASSLS